jgi:hypothetical protein
MIKKNISLKYLMKYFNEIEILVYKLLIYNYLIITKAYASTSFLVYFV